MDKIKQFEDSLNMADEVHFHLTWDYNKDMSAIKLGFANPDEGIVGYMGIHILFKNLETTLIIFKNKKDTLDISIVSKDTADTLNIKNLKYENDNLSDFIQNEPTNRKFHLLIGPNPSSGGRALLPTDTSILLIDEYSVIQRP